MTRDEILKVMKDQHDAIDSLFASLIVLTRDHTPDTPFFPSKSGRLWDACVAGNEMVKRLEAGEPVG